MVLVLLVVVLLDMGAELLVDGTAAAPPDDGVLVEPHAANPIGITAARATKTAPRRALLVRAIMVVSYFPASV